MELSVTSGLVAAGFGIFALAVKYLPIFEDQGAPKPLIEHSKQPKPVRII